MPRLEMPIRCPVHDPSCFSGTYVPQSVNLAESPTGIAAKVRVAATNGLLL
jgi:hypothetical protein